MDQSLFRFVWRNSRPAQLAILVLIAASLPFYFASLDIPKKIVNDALQGRAFMYGRTTVPLIDWSLKVPEVFGGGHIAINPGIELDRMGYLFALSTVFLGLVLINGAFKYEINVRKGVLGERMLRLLRYELFALLLRLRPEDVRAIKPAEVASMIKDEVEPIGGFAGDAFIQPVFLGAQALTALAFILLQNVWLGAIALSIVLIQAFVIPRLRREQIRLGRERQIESRSLAGRIGAVVEVAPVVHIHGASDYQKAGVNRQLMKLLGIRVDLFKRKFAVKFLNNLLAQITPFFFFAVGGYFALRGQLDIGQLVAVIVAYRDLPPPIKELIDWDQQRADVAVKYQQVVSQFTSAELASPPVREASAPSPDAPLRLEAVTVVDRQGTTLLDPVSTEIRQPAHVAIVGAAASGRDILARVLGRQITELRGSVRIGSHDLQAMSDEEASRFLAYAGADPGLFPSSIRENITMSLCRKVPVGDSGAAMHDWIDYAAAGVSNADELDKAIIRVLGVTKTEEDIYRLGLLGRLDAETDPALARRVVDARVTVRERLYARDLMRLIEPFDPELLNTNATLGENLLFGVPLQKGLMEADLVSEPYFRSVVEASGLTEPLSAIGFRMAEITFEMFADLAPGHPLLERYSFIAAGKMEEYRRLVEIAQVRGGPMRLEPDGISKLVALALKYVEARHRLQLVDDALATQIVAARKMFREGLPRAYAGAIEFYAPDRYLLTAPVRDNLLFGRPAFGLPEAEQQLSEVLRETLVEIGLDHRIYQLGLDFDVGPGGKLLFPPQRAAINLARCLVRNPQILILEGALSAFGAAEARAITSELRRVMPDQTLIVTVSDAADSAGFDCVLGFEGTRLAYGAPALGVAAQ